MKPWKIKTGLFIISFCLLTACASPEAIQVALMETGTMVAVEIYATQTAQTPTVTVTPSPTLTPTVTRRPTSTPAPSRTPTQIPTNTPTLIPAVIGLWDHRVVKSVCLSTTQDFPQFEKDPDLKIEDTLIKIFKFMEINLEDDPAKCDAQMTIDLEGNNYSKTYSSSSSGSKKCFTGASISGVLTFKLQEANENAAYEPIVMEFRGGDSPMMISSCAIEPTIKVGWGKAWIPEIIYRLVDIWGMPAAIAALKTNDSIAHAAGVSQLKGEAAIEAVPILTSWLSGKGQGGVAYANVANALGRIGPKARMAVPYLIEQYKNEVSGNGTFAYEYRTALEQITGLDDNDDPAFWSSWWEMVSAQDIPAIMNTLSNSPDPEERRAAAETLGTIFIEGDQALVVEALAKALTDTDVSVRESALKAIAKFGPSASAAAPAVMERLMDDIGGSESGQLYDTIPSVGVEMIPPLVQYISTNIESGESMGGNRDMALILLKRMTGLPVDEKKRPGDQEDWRDELSIFLDKCLDYYRANSQH